MQQVVKLDFTNTLGQYDSIVESRTPPKKSLLQHGIRQRTSGSVVDRPVSSSSLDFRVSRPGSAIFAYPSARSLSPLANIKKPSPLNPQKQNGLSWNYQAHVQRALNGGRIRCYEVLGAEKSLAVAGRMMMTIAEEGLSTTEQLLEAR